MTLTDEIDVHVRHRLANRRASTSFDFEHNGIRFVATYSQFADGGVGEILSRIIKQAATSRAYRQENSRYDEQHGEPR